MGTHTWDLTSSGGPHLSFVILEKLNEMTDELLPHELRADGFRELY